MTPPMRRRQRDLFDARFAPVYGYEKHHLPPDRRMIGSTQVENDRPHPCSNPPTC